MSVDQSQMRSDKHGLDDADYNRSRLEPSFGDPAYVALADLRMALDRVRSDEEMRVLDYGAGGRPIVRCFQIRDYRRADCVELPGLDYIFGADEKISESDEVFDLVLSTQVLEHVRHPQLYLREAWRLLRPGGRIIVSTHGLFEEHGAPIDFRRWTLEGLFCELEEAGFRRGRGWKLTCGPRALLFWAMRHGGTGKPTMKSFFGAGWNAVRVVATGNLSWLNRQADRHFGKFAVMEDGAQTPPIYVGVLAVGHKETRT